MDQLSAMRAFVRVVETGNFTRAAASLDMPKTSVTNLVQGLEAHLSTKLLNRTTRRVTVTTDGALYYERAQQLISELDELDMSLSHAQGQPSGKLRVEMAGAFADGVLIPGICDFYQRYPQIVLDVGVGDRLVDYIAENVDCALRAGTPKDEALIGRKVGELEMKAYAAPSYLERFGAIGHPQDIEADHYAVGYLNPQTGRVLPMTLRRGNEVIDILPRYIVSFSDSRSYINGAVAGMGVVMAPEFFARDAMARGELVEVLPGWLGDPIPLYIVYPQTRHLSNKVRVFADWMAKQLQVLNKPNNGLAEAAE